MLGQSVSLRMDVLDVTVPDLQSSRASTALVGVTPSRQPSGPAAYMAKVHSNSILLLLVDQWSGLVAVSNVEISVPAIMFKWTQSRRQGIFKFDEVGHPPSHCSSSGCTKADKAIEGVQDMGGMYPSSQPVRASSSFPWIMASMHANNI